MAASKKPMSPIRFDSRAQIDRIRRAARIEKRSFNQFVVLAAHNAAEKLLEAQKSSEQLMVTSDRLSLNQ